MDVLLNHLSLQESQSSSAIENIVTTNDQIYRSFALKEQKTPEIEEVLTYRQALWSGYEYIQKKPLDRNVFIHITQTIKNNTKGIRDGQENTRLTDGLGRVIYIPPQDKAHIDALLQNLESYIQQKNGLDPLIKMGIIHYQYESIHPFPDGNGRSGRITNILYLLQQKKIEYPISYLSRYIMNRQSEYYRGFEKVKQQNDWYAWLTYLLNGIRETADYTYQQVLDIHQLQLATEKIISHLSLKKINPPSFTKALYTQPYCRLKNFITDQMKSKKSIMSYLERFITMGLLEKEKTSYGFIYKNIPLSCALQQTEMSRTLFQLFHQYGYRKHHQYIPRALVSKPKGDVSSK